jgi:CheY-like chemotaxis protein
MDRTPSKIPLRDPVRIVLVDDHPNTARTLARAISRLREGLEVLSATSGPQALELAGHGAVDILVTDMMMPGMNGFELIERLQAHAAGRPLHTILMTAYDVPGLQDMTRRLNVQATLIKPVPTERICQIVNQVLDIIGQSIIPVQAGENQQRFRIMVGDDARDNLGLLARRMENKDCGSATAADGVEVAAKDRLDMPDLAEESILDHRGSSSGGRNRKEPDTREE